MSVKVSSWVWHGDECSELAGNELVLMLALADVAGDEGRCRFMDDETELTYDALAEKVRVDRRTIERLTKKLRELGLIEQRRGTKARPNEFRILVPWARKSPDNLSGNQSEAGSDSPTPDADSPTSDAVFPDKPRSRTSLLRIDVTDVDSSAADAPTTPGEKFAQPLCDVLVTEMLRNEAKVPPSMPKKWLDAARLMVDRDGRDPHQAKALIEWACRNSFWRSNIMSMPTFRAQYDRLRLQAREQQERRGGASTVEHGRSVDQILQERAAAREQAEQRALT